jgi:glycosyltransferase involved in cell wall biosynthesis
VKVRIIVATLGERASLENCFKSINKQDFSEIEVVIVTPSRSIKKVEELAKEILKYNYQVIEDNNKGLSAAINQGFEAAGEFEYFSWLNDDDELTIGSIKRSKSKLDSNHNYSAVVGTLEYRFENSNKVLLNKVSKLKLIISEFGPNLIPQPGSLIRKVKIDSFLLNENYQYAMDLDLFLRLKKKGKIGLIKDIQALLNYDSDTITLKNRRNATKEAFQIRMLNSRNILIKFLNLFFYTPTYFLMYIIKYLIKS